MTDRIEIIDRALRLFSGEDQLGVKLRWGTDEHKFLPVVLHPRMVYNSVISHSYRWLQLEADLPGGHLGLCQACLMGVTMGDLTEHPYGQVNAAAWLNTEPLKVTYLEDTNDVSITLLDGVARFELSVQLLDHLHFVESVGADFTRPTKGGKFHYPGSVELYDVADAYEARIASVSNPNVTLT